MGLISSFLWKSVYNYCA